MKKTTKIALVGFWVVLAALILYLGINYLKGLSVFSNEKYYYARFKDVSGIVVASPVLINGYKVGTVQGLEFDMEHDATTLVKVNIDKSIRLPKGTSATARLSLFGGAQLDLHLGASSEILEQGGYLETVPPDNDPMSVVTNTILPTVVKMLPKIDSTLSAINTIANDPVIRATLKEVHATVQRANVAMQGIEGVVAKVDGYMKGDVANILRAADSSAVRLERFTRQLDEIELKTLVQNLETSSEELRKITQQINSTDGTIGKLVHNNELYNEINGLLQTIDTLVKDIKANPKKYLKISVF